MPERPRLTAAILSYDGRHLLEVVLPSLAAQTLTDFETVVVDNGSRDETVAWLAEHWPQVRVVALPENVGVTAALNVCVDAARGELVGLFNNDIEVAPDALAELVDAMDRHPEAGSACAKLVDFHDRDVLDGAGDVFAWQGSGGRRGHGERDVGQYDTPQAVFGACGGAAVYRREALAVVGLFDADFFAFYEDLDWALRAQLAGFTCRYVPSAVVYHMGSATLGKGMTDFTRHQLTRNTVWMVAKCYPAGALMRYAPQLGYEQVDRLRSARRDGRLGVWRRAMGEALRGLPRALRKRRAVQRTRRLTVAQLAVVVRDGQRRI